MKLSCLRIRRSVWGPALLLALGLAGSSSAFASELDGLDMTIEVLGKEQAIDDRTVNRIQIPVLGGGAVAAQSGDGSAGKAVNRQGLAEGPVLGPVLAPRGGTLSTVDGLANGVLGALGLGAQPQE